MTYKIKAHPTKYNGVQFRSRLEARWACFFDLAGWKWEYEPIDLEDWTPDFRVKIEDPIFQDQILLVEVKPYYSIAEFDEHPSSNYIGGKDIPADSSAVFGINPWITRWLIMHRSGGNWFELTDFIPYESLTRWWNQAGNTVQWKPHY